MRRTTAVNDPLLELLVEQLEGRRRALEEPKGTLVTEWLAWGLAKRAYGEAARAQLRVLEQEELERVVITVEGEPLRGQTEITGWGVRMDR